MYIPKHCPDCGEGRKGFVETQPNHLSCIFCGREFTIKVTFDLDKKYEFTEIKTAIVR